MRSHITRALYAAAAAGIALFTLGFAGAGSPAAATPRSLGPPVYSNDAGYAATGRWFRYVATTVTVPPVIPSKSHACNMLITLANTAPMHPRADLLVRPGGGSGSVGWGDGQTLTPLALSPKIGDRLRISIYYDRNGHTYFTAADVTQGITRTVRVKTTGKPVYNEALLAGNAGGGPVPPPPADTRLWQVTNTQLTTYTGIRGTVTGPWQTSQLIHTSTGTAAGTVLRSPSGLWNGGANFGVWLRALPLAYTSGFAGYTDSVGPFRFVATTMTVPPAQTPAANGGTVLVSLGHNGGPAPRPYANIEVLPGGGAGSISYDSNAEHGTFTVNPKPGDQLSASIYYDRHGHYAFTVTDTTRATTQAVTVAAPYADSMPLNSAQVLAMFDNSRMTPPPADTQIWQFTGSHVTTYGGNHGSILGPWATSRWIDTTDAGAVVADASVLSNAGQEFGVWLRHH